MFSDTIYRFNKKLYNLRLQHQAYEFLGNVSMLIKAGVLINDAMVSIAEDIDSKRMKKHIKAMVYDIQQGANISTALANTNLFNEHTLALITLGEKLGQLPQNMDIAKQQYDKELLFKSRLRSSLLYSAVVLVLALVVGAVSMWFTLPKIADLYAEIGTDLPQITQILISSGDFIKKYGAIFMPIVLALFGAVFYFLFSFPRTRFIGHIILFRVPLLKKLIKEVELSRFGYFLGNMLRSGMPIIESLTLLKGISTFKGYQNMYVDLQQSVSEGYSLYDSFKRKNEHKNFVFTTAYQIIKAAEQSGNLPEALLELGKIYEVKSEATARDLPTMLEPILLIIIGLVVVALALGTILPMYSLLGAA